MRSSRVTGDVPTNATGMRSPAMVTSSALPSPARVTVDDEGRATSDGPR